MLQLTILGEPRGDINNSILRAVCLSIPQPSTIICNISGICTSPNGQTKLENFADLEIDWAFLEAHVLSRPNIRSFAGLCKTALRPLNMPQGCPGKAFAVLQTSSGSCHLVVLDTGNDRMPLDPPWKFLSEFESALEDNLPIIVFFTGTNFEMKQAFFQRVLTFARPIHIIGSGMGCIAGHALIQNGKAFVLDVGIMGNVFSVGGIPPEVWWQRSAHIKISLSQPECIIADAIAVTLDDGGRAITVERRRIKP